jgi:hypothetical protein
VGAAYQIPIEGAVVVNEGCETRGRWKNPKRTQMFNKEKKEIIMDNTTLIIIIVVLVVLFGGGGGYYWNRRR